MSREPVTLLIDGDVIVYKAALAAQTSLQWDQDIYTVTGDLRHGIAEVDTYVRSLMSVLRGTKAIVALSDPRANWRKDVLPTYKATRGDKARPVLYHQLRAYLVDTYDTRQISGLEGDDIMGLYATGRTVKGKRIIVSIDKDMQQVPGFLYNPMKPDQGVREVSVDEADRFHLTQALTGDAVDGYAGCPGCGPKCAAKVLAESGAKSYVGGVAWEDVVRRFEKSGLTEADALVQARVARILRAGEYDKAEGKVLLWTPKGVKA